MDELIFRSHAIERMMERDISSAMVDKILKSPDGVINQSFEKKIVYKRIKNRSDNLIAIVILGRSEVLTVMNFFEVKK